MRILLSIVFAMLFVGGAQAQAGLSIKLAHDSATERATKAQLERLLSSDLSRWMFTRAIVIEDEAIPHSNPVLTLSTRHLRDDDLLLSTFLHEELHWFIKQHQTDSAAAVAELRVLFPTIPVGYPQGSLDEDGNYYHMVVIPLEYAADRAVMGELRARQVMEFWAGDHYTWLYRATLDHPAEIGRIIRKHNLIPDALKTPAKAG